LAISSSVVSRTRKDYISSAPLGRSRNSAFRPKTQGLHVFTCRRLAKSYETPANIILGPMD
jgi:hypothetical protein